MAEKLRFKVTNLIRTGSSYSPRNKTFSKGDTLNLVCNSVKFFKKFSRLCPITCCTVKFCLNLCTHIYPQLHEGKVAMSSGNIKELLQRYFDLSPPLAWSEVIFLSRAPLPVTSLGNITDPFTVTVWLVVIITLFSLSLYLLLAHQVYVSENLRHENLAVQEEAKGNFFIFTFCKISEPEPLPWFRKWSAGKMAVLIWMVFSLAMTMFYTSNLRAHLIAIKYEKPIDTLQDILDNGKRPWMYKASYSLK